MILIIMIVTILLMILLLLIIIIIRITMMIGAARLGAKQPAESADAGGRHGYLYVCMFIYIYIYITVPYMIPNYYHIVCHYWLW